MYYVPVTASQASPQAQELGQKIVHAGRQDLMIFYDMTGEPARNVVDTQVAAALLGHGDAIGGVATSNFSDAISVLFR